MLIERIERDGDQLLVDAEQNDAVNRVEQRARRKTSYVTSAFGIAQIEALVEHYNHRRYHESVNNVTPADAYSDGLQPSSKSVKGSSERPSNIGACNTVSSPHNLKPQTKSALSYSTQQIAPKVLMTDKREQLKKARAMVLSRATMRNIHENLLFAFAYNAIGIPIAAGVLYPSFGILLSPIIGALAMSLSSLSVIANALRLRTLKL